MDFDKVSRSEADYDTMVENQLEKLNESEDEDESGCSTCSPSVRRTDLRQKSTSALARDLENFDPNKTSADFLHVCKDCGHPPETHQVKNAL